MPMRPIAAAAEFEKVFAQHQLPDDMPEVEIAADPIMASKLLTECGLVDSAAAKRNAWLSRAA